MSRTENAKTQKQRYRTASQIPSCLCFPPPPPHTGRLAAPRSSPHARHGTSPSYLRFTPRADTKLHDPSKLPKRGCVASSIPWLCSSARKKQYQQQHRQPRPPPPPPLACMYSRHQLSPLSEPKSFAPPSFLSLQVATFLHSPRSAHSQNPRQQITPLGKTPESA